MDSYVLVRTEHLNHNNQLFGGQLLKWVDEYAYIGASLDFKENSLVTRAMEQVDFHYGVPNGTLLRFHVERINMGRTSATYSVDVYAEDKNSNKSYIIFSNKVTFVAVNENGKKTPLKPSFHA